MDINHHQGEIIIENEQILGSILKFCIPYCYSMKQNFNNCNKSNGEIYVELMDIPTVNILMNLKIIETESRVNISK